MMKIKSNFPVLYIATMSLIYISLFSLVPHLSFGQLQANVTSRCENGNCTTTICVNDQPCKTTNSNSTNITSFGDLIENKTIPAPKMPGELV
jgi:hypothetical protein